MRDETIRLPGEVPLPAFRQPHLHRLDSPPESHEPSPDETTSPPDNPAPNETTDARPEPIESSPERPAARRTRTSGTGDPTAAGKAIGGLLVILAGALGALLARSGRHLRQPTPRQVDDIAGPLGAIAARHLPTEFLTADLLDVTTAAAATHRYVLDDDAGPLLSRTATAAVNYPEEV